MGEQPVKGRVERLVEGLLEEPLEQHIPPMESLGQRLVREHLAEINDA